MLQLEISINLVLCIGQMTQFCLIYVPLLYVTKFNFRANCFVHVNEIYLSIVTDTHNIYIYIYKIYKFDVILTVHRR